jgi:hypothetical protein
MKRRLAVLLATVVAAFGAATANAHPFAAPAAIARACSVGYTHAVIGGAEKCLRAGEFCARRYDRQYQHYGFRCIRYYANVGRYRLTHA